MKRCREEDRGFRFSFGGGKKASVGGKEKKDEGEGQEGQEGQEVLAPAPASFVRVLSTAMVWNPASGVVPGGVYAVDWGCSTESLLQVDAGGKPAFIPAASVELLRSAEDVESNTLIGTHHMDAVWHLDTVFPDAKLLAAPAAPGAGNPLVRFPLVVEAGLGSFCWPLSESAFQASVAHQRCLVVHALPSRLSQLKAAFHNFDTEAMVGAASRVVVWMKAADGTMQYLDAEPGVAMACYRAGHSLYFNPSVDVQAQFVGPLLDDLGMAWGVPPPTDLCDVEVFAVQGTHDTPWHFDAQEAFTLQLEGTKRWTVARGATPHPVTNLHPRSSNAAGVETDRLAHAACGLPDLPTEPCGETHSFVLRPGSAMYLPAGWWHKVSALDADAGSLSMNFSVSGERWSAWFAKRLAPMLWATPGWRRPVAAPSVEAARATLDGLLGGLRGVLSKVSAADFLPAGSGDSEVVHVADGGAGRALPPDATLTRSPAWVLAVHGAASPTTRRVNPPPGSFVASLHTGVAVGAPSAAAVEFVVPDAAKGAVLAAAAVPPGEAAPVGGLAVGCDVAGSDFQALLAVLQENGYFTAL